MAATAIFGRDQELGSIRRFLAGVERGPAALLLSGEAGIGKTILWEAGVEESEQRVNRVLVHRSVEAESLLSFAGLSDLLSPIFEEIASSLAPPRRRALEVALLLAEPGEEPADPRAIGLAVLDGLRALAEGGAVVIALDDVQWLDSASAAALRMALRRLGEEPVGLLATLRKVPAVAGTFELDSAFADERLERVWVGPLSLGALHHLLKERLGLELTRPELARVQETSGGNPFFAIELGRELLRTETRSAPGQVLRVPENLRELVGGRLERLRAETTDLLLSAAALARPTVDLITAAADEEPERVLEHLERAVREGVVWLDDSRVRFAHPLLASICYERAPQPKRRAVHRALAEAVTDVEERARHRALAAKGPDAQVASELEVAAEQAAVRGATAAAAELCELAAELTPSDPALGRQRRMRAAHFHRLAGDPERTTALLEQLLTEVPGGVERADVLLELAWTRSTDPRTMIQLCDEALAVAADDDARSARILGYRSWARLAGLDAGQALVDARAALEKAERVGDSTLLAVAIARMGQVGVWTSDVTRELLERGAEIEEGEGLVLEYLESPRFALVRLLLRLGELDRGRTVLEDLEAKATARGDERTRGQLLWYLALVDWLDGVWPRALEYARLAYELTEQTQDPHPHAMVGRVKAVIEADLGLVDEARASADEGLDLSRSISAVAFAIASLAALGRIELELGDLEAAGGYLRELPARLLEAGVNDPAAPVWADAIETLVSLGELDLATTYIEQYETHAQTLGSPYAIAGAARSRGLLAAAEGDLEGALEAHERALAALEGLTYPLERARTLLCKGSAHRQAKQKRAARNALEEALAIFEELGAPLWAEKARAELRRISGRRRSSEEELTEMEERVAALAAEGRSNKEIAAELFVSVHTVSAHLSRAYRKLGINSRTELAGRLAVPEGETAAKPAK